MADFEIKLDGDLLENEPKEKEIKEKDAWSSMEESIEDERIQEYIERRRQERQKKRRRKKLIGKIAGVVALVAIVAVCAVFVLRACDSAEKKAEEKRVQEQQAKAEAELKKQMEDAEKEKVLSEAEFLAAGYDYDAAIEKIKSFDANYAQKSDLAEAVKRFESTKATMVRYENVTDITHVFFHTLIADTSLAFDGDYEEAGYNQYMTTIDEFNKMMEIMYAKGYVLVDIHDIAKEEVQPDGSTKFVPGDIWLPEGKIPFVMSQDDVSYYHYMDGDGFATKIVIGEDGYPTCEYVKEDGTVVYGDYDLVPLLETFIQKHPDFSYRGARAALAITGYNGVLGYRTSPTDDGYYNPDDIEEAKKVAERMRECGWTFASHSWGHQRYGQISYEKMKTDALRWEEEVRPILGDVDVLIYAHGDDIAGIGAYSGDKYEFLKSLGFKYYCNVDSSKAWVQIRDGYVRQGRRNLDGYRMWYSPDRLRDLFDVEDVFDPARPTPVPSIV